MGGKTPATTVSKISSASAPSTSTSNSSDKSSILKSSFAPSALQLHLFASVIQSFDSQHLRIHDTNTGRLRQQHAARPGVSITSLDWGHYGTSHKQNGQSTNNKKRKTVLNSTEDIVIGYGTSSSEICMYSHSEGRVVGTLSGAHDRGIKDFRFTSHNPAEGWSLGGDGKLVQWDLSKDLVIRSISLPDSSVSTLSSPSQYEPRILCASTKPFSIYPSDDFKVNAFMSSFKGQIQSLKRSGRDSKDSAEYVLAADNDRYINVFDIGSRTLATTLVVGGEVEQLDLFSAENSNNTPENQLLAVVTRDGIIELFAHPFKMPTVANGNHKSAHRNKTRKAGAQVKLVTANRKSSKILTASLQGPDLVVVSIDGGVDPAFQKIRWQDEDTGELLFQGVKEILKIKSSSTLNAAQMNGVKDMGKTQVDESRTVVINGTGDLGTQDATIEISSGDEDENAESENESESEAAPLQDAEATDESEDEDEDDEDKALVIADKADGVEDTEMQDAQDQEPSFGELLASKHPNTITIADSFQPEKSSFDASKQLALPAGMSLGTVLTQALRTNDTNLLESCLHANDAGIIQNTIQRLDSGLAAKLLSKLAERLASRPGRYGHLLSWVQWTCIAHGGAIAAQADVAGKIRTLYKVLTQRSKSLDKLLLLKGKLDMLDAQLTLRKQVQSQRGAQDRDSGEPGMIYIEGEGDNWSSDEDIDEAAGVAKVGRRKKTKGRSLDDLIDQDATSEDDDDDEMPTTNGVASEGSEEEYSDEDAPISNKKAGILDLEADVSGEEDEEDDDMEDSDEDEDENEDEDEDEDDSSMDSFINDGELSIASDQDDIDLDDEPEIRKPEKKRSKHR